MDTKAKKKLPIAKIVTVAAVAAIVTGFAIGDVYLGLNKDFITTALAGTGAGTSMDDKAQEASSSLCEEIAENGIALLKNNGTLPLNVKDDDKYINLFGWSSSDNGFLLSGIGSGSSTISESKKVTLTKAFENDGWEVNEDLVDFYKEYDDTEYGYTNKRDLIEPDPSSYKSSLIADAVDWSDTAVVVFSRLSGENVGEIPDTQTKSNGQGTDSTRNYLELSTEEEGLLDLVEENFENVIVLINSTNQMSLGKLNDEKIDAVLNVSILGQSGANAIPKILNGDITPSGHLADTYAYDYRKEPSYNNKLRNFGHINYSEDIYFGYRWYETAFEEGYFAKEKSSLQYDREGNRATLTDYDAVVQYPFGYGLSYTTFSWKLDKIQVSENGENIRDSLTNLTEDSHVELSFSCTNTGSTYSGKDVMQLYFTAPYTSGGIEKSVINLVDYAKSVELNPGQVQKDIIVSFDLYDLACYDCYDKNEDGKTGYVLDEGEYELRFMKNAHEEQNLSGNHSLTFTLDENICYDKDPVTGNEVKNRFTGSDAYSGVPLDGSTLYTNSSDAPKYLSRASHFGSGIPSTFKKPTNTDEVSKANNYTNDSYNQTSMPTLNKESNLRLVTKEDGSYASLKELDGTTTVSLKYNDELLQEIGTNYDSEKLTQLVDQVSAEEACNLVDRSGFATPAIESIGKTKNFDFDGPAGFNQNTQVVNKDNEGVWTAFPCENLIGQTWDKTIAKKMGLQMGVEAHETGLSGWYAPGVNMHRSPFNGRNYEYYSEDPVLNGYMAANVIDGAKANNLYCYLKHFTLSEPGQNARDLNTWLTEQNFREIYLKPFEIAVKKGGANAIMSAFNYVGGVWAGANKAMNVDVLRDEWGFRGTMITDWSDGSGSMNTPKGVKAMNDIWLTPTNNASSLDRNNPTLVYCAKQSVKNVIYTYANTYTYAKNYDHSKDSITVDLDTITINKAPFAWWIPVVIAIEVLAAAGLGFWVYFVVIRKPKPKAEANTEEKKD